MPVRYDTNQETFVIDPEDCPDCGQSLYQSGCNGLACQDCGTGCDLDFVDAEDGGRRDGEWRDYLDRHGAR